MEDEQRLDGVGLNIQAVNIEVDDDFRDRIVQSLGKLRRYYSGDVIIAEVYMREEAHPGPNEKSLRIRCGVPGTEVFAEESGQNWDAMLNDVTAKLKRQLEHKFANSQNSYRNR
ncbi:HPF/RaiA family ribosome-associated protein [Spirosoma soli]|uniref:HPF/RaiA family ribosome-associated protein n=1 Tax=Spirosoma soli TaxID=1770529 RepID=A0ABW5LYX8_9BACT